MVRFIPARAGNGLETMLAVSRIAVHPRACGERTPNLSEIVTTTGSSPRVRGNQSHAGYWIICNGSIPARAGEPFSILPSSGKPSARAGYRGTPRTISGSWKEHLDRPPCAVPRDDTLASCRRRSVDSARRPSAVQRPGDASTVA